MINNLLLLAALLALLGLAFFIFYCYPESWRKKRILKIILLVFHGIGSITLAVIFTCYRDIPFDWLKWVVSRFGTVYLVVILLLSAFFILWIAGVGILKLISHVRALKSSEHTIHLFHSSMLYSVLAISLSFLIAFIGVFNIGNVRIKEYELSIPKECSENDLDVVMLSDIHAGAGTWKDTYDNLAKAITKINPDILLLGGDIFDETTSTQDVRRVTALLDSLHPKYGIYFVYGNHDSEASSNAIQALADTGVHILEDDMVLIGEDIQLIGRLDQSLGAKSPAELLNENGIRQDLPVIVLQHRPVEFRMLADSGADLAFAGHTHGFSIPFGLYVTMANDMVSGCRQYNDMTAITSAGVSAWGIHYKWPAQSDIVHVHITFGE